MTATDPTPVPEPTPEPPSRPAVIDARPLLTRGLPRHLQTWIMAGLATLILGVILLTGHSTPPAQVVSTGGAPPLAVPPERIRSYQAQLAEQEARLRAEQAAPLLPVLAPPVSLVASPPVEDALEDEERRRDRTSLFADNVAFSRRVTAAPPMLSEVAATGQAPTPAAPVSMVGGVTDPSPSKVVGASVPQASSALSTPAPTRRFPEMTLPEGTLIEAVLVNRLDGTFRGPVQALVTAPVYDTDRQAVVIPAGARILGSAAPVQAWGDTRLAVAFHRVLWPDGRSLSLDAAPGLNGIGEAGLRDQVDRHYWQVFGASVAIGALSGLAQLGTRGGFDQSAADGARQSAGASLAASTGRVLDRYLNVLPTVTIREGHRLRIVLTRDLVLPVSGDTSAPQAHIAGGVQ